MERKWGERGSSIGMGNGWLHSYASGANVTPPRLAASVSVR